ITNNRIDSCGEEGILLYWKCNYNNISANIIINGQEWGIYIDSDSDGNTLIGNILNNNLFGCYTEEVGCDNNQLIFNVCNYTLNPLIIDDSGDGNFTWSEASEWTAWCSGSGTWNNPYLIENVHIDANEVDNGIMIKNSISYFIIRNCIIINANDTDKMGINLYLTENGKLINNHLDNNFYGVYVLNGNNNSIADNDIINSRNTGIYIVGSGNAKVLNNFVNNSWGTNIYVISSSDNCLIFNNTASNSQLTYGIYLFNNVHCNVTFNLVEENSDYGIYINLCDFCNISSNIINYNNWDGIRLRQSHNSTISDNDINYNIWDGYSGIFLEDSNNNSIVLNTIMGNRDYGIELDSSNHTTIAQNILRYNEDGCSYETNCQDNSYEDNWCQNIEGYWVLDPIVIDNDGGGDLTWTEAAELPWCSGAGSWEDPYLINNLYIDAQAASSALTIRDSEVYFIVNGSIFINALNGVNLYAGIHLYNVNNSQISKCNCSNNYLGIYLEAACNNNTIYGSIIDNNGNYGIYIGLGSDNLIYYNNLTQNGDNAMDMGSDNAWNSTTIGNYWDDYAGVDLDDDGIGDSNYTITLMTAYDCLPICNDGDNLAPTITIISPTDNELFGPVAPNFTIHVADANFHKMWYTLDNSFTNVSFTNNETFQQSLWDDLENGTLTIRFYANDTRGNLGYADISILIDVEAPSIDIHLPTNETAFKIAPWLNISASDFNGLDTIWYSINGVNETLEDNQEEQILNSIWNAIPEGPFTIYLYANDSLGNLNNSLFLTLYKDTSAPEITSIAPEESSAWNNEPLITISATDPHLDKIWFSNGTDIQFIDNGIPEVLLTSIWESFNPGLFTLYLYANDTAGNINTTCTLTLYKDLAAPTIIINDPLNDSVSKDAPSLKITAIDPNFDTLWYGNGTVNETLENGVPEELLSSIWDHLDQGEFTLFLYANDTAGNLNHLKSLRLYKDTVAPFIEINLPEDTTIYNTRPLVNISASDLNPIHTIWYNVNGIEKIVQNGGQELLLASIWDSLDQGEFLFNVYANDSLGNVNASLSLTLFKDTLAPKIIVNEPQNGESYNNAPWINITYIDPNYDSVWYVVDGIQKELVNSSREELLSSIWSALDEGEFTLYIYANDSVGNLNDSVVLTLYKDTESPVLIVNDPENFEVFGTGAPEYYIEIIEQNIDTIWYTLEQGSQFSWREVTQLADQIDQTLWNNFQEGMIELTFYVNDSFGLTTQQKLHLYKYIDKWVLPSFSIDDSGNGDLTWEEAGTQPWCKGSGSVNNPYILKNLWINASDSDFCIIINNSQAYFVIKESTFFNASWANVMLRNVENGKIVDCNSSFGNVGIQLYNTNSTQIYGNLLRNCKHHGIAMENSNFIDIENNDAFDNREMGIILQSSHNCSISGNEAYNNEIGIVIAFNCHNNTIIDNKIHDNIGSWGYGVAIYYSSHNNSVIENTIYGNGRAGIAIYQSESNLIAYNIIEFNLMNGLFINESSYNVIRYNNLTSNVGCGINLTSGMNNLFYFNRFLFNGLNAFDNGTTNNWDNGEYGNFWHDYQGKDEDKDGIGDSYYNIVGIANANDTKPLWTGEDYINPIILINSPSGTYGKTAPAFNINVIENAEIDTMWYTVDNGLTNFTFTMNQTLNQALWDSLSEGIIILRFYANDTVGNIGFNEISITKDLPEEQEKEDKGDDDDDDSEGDVGGGIAGFNPIYLVLSLLMISIVFIWTKKRRIQRNQKPI
ncbi:MAG: hypothetical protein EU548_04020, partial [Promethearchaeota archaeon]